VIRKHRLWEVFLVNKLGFNWDEVHEIAEQLEHIKSSLLITRLDEFLGFPKFDPHGDPIPDEDGTISSKPRMILSELGAGEEAELVSMNDTGNAFLNYLDRIDLKIGSRVRILEIMEFDGSREMLVNGGKRITISQQVSDNLLVVRH
jgi:DtxR family Mn-dependent transcriptional regulator